MAAPMKTPGVYVVEKSAFPNSVVEVATAVPAFVGYTKKADVKGRDLHMKPWAISSLAEFEDCFGGAPDFSFTLKKPTGTPGAPAASARPQLEFRQDGARYQLEALHKGFLLHLCMRHFFMNGGGRCYVVSVGTYDDAISGGALSKGIAPLSKEQEPTMLLIPDALSLSRNDCYGVQEQMLAHCGDKMRSRIAVLDVWGGFADPDVDDAVGAFREGIGANHLDFGAAYYPWLDTTVVEGSAFDVGTLDAAGRSTLKALIEDEPGYKALEGKKKASVDEYLAALLTAGAPGAGDPAPVTPAVEADGAGEGEAAVEGGGGAPAAAGAKKTPLTVAEVSAALTSTSPGYKLVIKHMREQVNLLPPASAMAGIMTMVDNSIGVWKAPANVSVASVVKPSVQISHDDQQDLNVPTNGKAVNAIRAFVGEGTLVWGARTLDGNSLDWRYINVRRTMIMLEESIRIASKAYVFEPNVANTWVTVKSMIRNFLTGIWKRGGLAGASPDAAFNVYCGLGETMTPEDILEGIMRVTVLVAPTRPAEFIEITFQQKMQES